MDRPGGWGRDVASIAYLTEGRMVLVDPLVGEDWSVLDAVLAAHGDTVEVLHRLTPIGVAMAGADTYDPYKD